MEDNSFSIIESLLEAIAYKEMDYLKKSSEKIDTAIKALTEKNQILERMLQREIVSKAEIEASRKILELIKEKMFAGQGSGEQLLEFLTKVPKPLKFIRFYSELDAD
ncbi:hypothetical protein ACFL35_11780 [Candidatus Riflebacteria bacterium]